MPEADKSPFLIRAYNRVVSFAGIEQPLDFDKLLRKARKNTGLHRLGNDFNEEALKALVRSVNEEARLHPFGRLMLREKLISQLENRLWAAHWFAKHPEILDQEVLPIILITGLQRTGTTKMQRLLSVAPGARALLSWEALYPAPLGQAGETKRRLARTRRNEKAVKWIAPTFQAIHPIHHDQPEEDILLLDLHFMSSSSEAILHVPSYARWLQEQDQTRAYAYERKLLLLLQWQQGGRHWVLKSPHHLELLPAFTRIFPDTRILWMHRPLSACIPSFLSMLYHSRAMFSDRVSQEDITEHWISKIGQMLQAGMEFRSTATTPVMDIPYQQLLEDESGVLDDIGQRFPDINIHLPAPWQGDRAEPYSSRHQYDLKDWGLNPEEIMEQFPNYQNLLLSLEKSKTKDDQQGKI